MFFVYLDVAALRLLGQRHLLLKLLVDLTATEGRDFELDRVDLMNQVRKTAGIRKLEELPKPKIQKSGVVERQNYGITEMVFQTEDRICLYARMFSPKDTESRGAVLYIHEKGGTADAFAGGPIEEHD